VSRELADVYQVELGVARQRVALLEDEVRQLLADYRRLTLELIRLKKFGFESPERIPEQPAELAVPTVPPEIQGAIVDRVAPDSAVARQMEHWAMGQIALGQEPGLVAEQILAGGDVEGALYGEVVED
jgi:hypothetical protein